MTHAWNPSEKTWRFHVVRAVLALSILLIFLRLVQIQIVEREKYVKQALEQYTRKFVVRANRGWIYDRSLTPLALNKPCYDIGIDKHFAKDLPGASKKLARILNQSQRTILEKIRRAKSFVLLARKLEETDASVIKLMNIPGVKVIRSSERVYPLNEKLAQVLGFVDVDGHGLSGIEFAFEHYLSGKDGKSVLQKDATGRTLMPVSSFNREQKSGNDVILTIDQVIQTIAEEELRNAVEENNAKGGSVIITNPQTGEILAMASLPGFDANHATEYKPETWRIRPITDIFEPGSTFKIVTLAAAVSHGIDKTREIVYCENGQYKIYGEQINDSKKHGWLSFEKVFIKSSNIGVAKIANAVGKNGMFTTSRNLGFGNRTGIELPGEVSGILKRPSEWSRFSLSAISYGHEVAVTPLQVAMAYGAIANGGKLMKPLIVTEVRSKDKKTLLEFEPQTIRRVMPPEMAEQLTEILTAVVESGTGKSAKIPHASIAGKTGTAQKPLADGSGYSNTKFVASFAGFYPSDQARILIYVILDEPTPAHSGGSVAAPTFRKILAHILEVDSDLEQRRVEPPTKKVLASKPNLIPDFTNRRLETAMRILHELGISPTIRGEGSIVQEQEVVTPANEKQEPEIILTLANYPDAEAYVTMPDLSRYALRKALCELSARGLNAKIVGSGRVVKQDPPAGSRIRAGAKCYLVCEPVSKKTIMARM